jgi:hypothetical protein
MTSYPRQRLNDALLAVGVTIAEAFAVNQAGNLLRGRHSAIRAAIYRHMRAPDKFTGCVLSYPEIAAVCGVPHSVVMAGCRRGVDKAK